MLQFHCANCRKIVKANESQRGRMAKCPFCKQAFQVPAAGQSQATTASPFRTPGSLASMNAGPSIAKHLAMSNYVEAARLLKNHDLWMIDVSDDPSESSPLSAQVGSNDMIVVFTSRTLATDYVNNAPADLFETDRVRLIGMEALAVSQSTPPRVGWLVNPDGEQGVVVSPDDMKTLKKQMVLVQAVQSAQPIAAVTIDNPQPRSVDPQAQAIRKQVTANLETRGFRFAAWLPYPDLSRVVRPMDEIAGRLMALGLVFAWASAPEDQISTPLLKNYLKDNGLAEHLTSDERNLLRLSRPTAMQQHGHVAGWRLENMWPMAWVLGYERQPSVSGKQIDENVVGDIVIKMLGRFEKNKKDLLAQASPKKNLTVLALEDHFYCAHNAVRCAQFSDLSADPAVPVGFDPVAGGGVIHERRHALTWSLSPGVTWDETDLST